MEQHLGFVTNRRGKALFYHLRLCGKARPVAIFCNALLEEAIFCQNHLARWSGWLAENGFNVMTFDYQGSGNSEGSHPVSADQMLDDLVDITDWYHRTYRKQPLFLIGIRFGFNLALKATARLNVTKVIGVEPIFHLEQYQTSLLRSNLTTQLSAFGRIVEDRRHLMTKLERGNRITVSGYDIDDEFFRSIERFQLQHMSSAADRMVFLRQNNTEKTRRKRIERALGKAGIDHAWIELEPFWTETRSFTPHQPALFHATKRFLSC